MTVYVLMSGVRYEMRTVLSVHETEMGARDKVATDNPEMIEQVPPANSSLASWIDEEMNCLCVHELGLQP